MRRGAVGALVAAAAWVGGAPSEANAQEVHALGAVDVFGTTPSNDPQLPPGSECNPKPPDHRPNGVICATDSQGADAELGLTLRAEVRHLGRFDLGLDYRDREGLIGRAGPSRRELFDLHATAHLGRFDLTAGRFATPGGFWLIVDGASLAARLGAHLDAQVYGGLRAFSGGRVETHLTSSPTALALAGWAVNVDHPVVHATLFFTYAQDQLDPAKGADTLTTDASGHSLVENDLFLSGHVVLLPHPNVYLAGALTLGSRYDLRFLTPAGTGPTPLTGVDVTQIGSVDAHAVAEWRPRRRLRLAYLFDFVRARVYQSQTPYGKVAAGPSFEDHTVRATLRPFGAARVEVRYRARFRENTDLIHRFEAALYGDDLWNGAGAFATVGADYYQTYHATPDPSRLVYSAGLSYVRQWLEARGGILYTDGLGGCTLALSSHVAGPKPCQSGTPTSELFPFSPESQRVAFVRVFGSYGGVFAGIDAELNLDASQLRALAQVGYAR